MSKGTIMSNIFMHVEGIAGSISAHGYADWINVDSLEFGIQRAVTTKMGSAVDRDSRVPQFSDMLITKSLDKSSCQLLQMTCIADVIPLVEIHICTTEDSLQPYVKYTLSNVMISDYKQIASANTTPIEQALLNFTKMQKTYLGQKNTSNTASPITVGYDILNAETL